MDLSIAGQLPWEGDALTVADVLTLLRRPPWHADGLCQEHPEVSWFPGRSESPEPAKALCRACLVRGECQTWAAGQGPALQGVWGGLSDNDRRRLRDGGQVLPPRVPAPTICRCCDRPSSGRLRSGLAEACYRAWMRSGATDLDRWIEERRRRAA